MRTCAALHTQTGALSYSHTVISLYVHADISKAKWESLMTANNWNAVELRDNRYNQIVHMVSAANGAEEFYSTEVSEWRRRCAHGPLLWLHMHTHTHMFGFRMFGAL